MKIKFFIEGQRLKRAKNNYIVADSKNFISADFEFSQEWTNIQKSAIFKNADTAYTVLLTDNECAVPYEVTGADFCVSVFGVKDNMRITTDEIVIRVEETGYCEGETPLEPTQSVYEQILGKLSDAQAKNTQIEAQLLTKADVEEVSAALGEKADKAQTEEVLLTKANKTEVDEALTLKADKTDVDEAMALKADKTEVDEALTLKADKTDVDEAMALKADKTEVDEALTLKADKTDVDEAMALKADKTDVDEAMALKADKNETETALSEKAEKTELQQLNTDIDARCISIETTHNEDIQGVRNYITGAHARAEAIENIIGDKNNLKTTAKMIVPAINETYQMVGDIETALDGIIELQNSYIGGESI